MLGGCSVTNPIADFVSKLGLEPPEMTTTEPPAEIVLPETTTATPEFPTDFNAALFGGDYFDATGVPQSVCYSPNYLENKKLQLIDAEIPLTDDDASAIKATEGSTALLENCRIITKGKSSSDYETKFYGLNSAVLCFPCSDIELRGGSIQTGGLRAPGVFAYGTNASVTATNYEIYTDKSFGIGMGAAYGGKIFATSSLITTSGSESPALYVGRGGGTVGFTGGSIATAGERSPAFYSCGTLSATGITAAAAASSAGYVEGNATLTLTGCDITAGGSGAFVLYQSNSGDSPSGKTVLNITGGKVAGKGGPLFYAANSDSIINMQWTDISSDSGTIVSAVADPNYGKNGENGGKVLLNAQMQKLNGTMYADNMSEIDIRLESFSTLTGSINGENTAKRASLTLDATSVWNLAADSHLTVFNCALTDFSNIKDNGNTIFYDSTEGGNDWLDGRTYKLSGGGMITPE